MLENKKKIIHIAFEHRYDDTRIFQKECISLSKENYEVIYITSNKLYDYAPIEQKIQNVRVIILNAKDKNRVIRLIKYLGKVKKIIDKEKPDICHFHELTVLPLIFLIKRDVKAIFDSHEDHPRTYFYKRKNYLSYRQKVIVQILEMLENMIVRRVDAIVAATPHIAEILAKKNKNTVIVCNYPILKETRQHPNNKIVNSSEPYICYCGGISENRGIVQMVEAMDNVQGKLLIAGLFPENLKKSLEVYPGWNRVISLGYLNSEQVETLYQKSCIGLCVLHNTPNIFYSLPIKIFEYMEAGLPVICSDFPIWKDIIEENNCGICISPGDSKGLSKAVNYILSNPQIALDMGENGKKLVHERWNWNVERKKLVELYQQI